MTNLGQVSILTDGSSIDNPGNGQVTVYWNSDSGEFQMRKSDGSTTTLATPIIIGMARKIIGKQVPRLRSVTKKPVDEPKDDFII